MPSPIIARADALMHRKRQSNPDLNDVPVLTDAIIEDDDFPLLTDIDSEIDPSLQEQAIPEPVASTIEALIDEPQEAPTASHVIDTALRDQLIHELTSRIEERLRAALPQIIHSTVKDFLAEQEMIANN